MNPVHCWHAEGTSYTNEDASYETHQCCYCGEQTIVEVRLVRPPGHGVHAPRMYREVIEPMTYREDCKR
jgi:hypothetical protein